MRRLACFTIVLSVGLLTPLSSHAQFGGTSNAGGASRAGSTGGAGGGFGGSSMGGQGGGFGGQAGGVGGGFGGQAGGAGGAFGGQAGGAGGAFGGQAGANGMNNQQGQGFLGRNTNQNQFLGRNLQGQGQTGGAQTGSGNRRAGGNRGGNNQNNMMNNQQGQGQGGMGGGAKAPVIIRARQKIAFEHTAPHLPTVSVKLETRLNKMTALKSSNLNLSVGSAGELVLKGEVANAEQAKLAENLARLEPGVRTVRNELTFPEVAPGKQ